MSTHPIRVGLAGNPNVGKSTIFNELTGLHQHVSNWPGKTVERAEGTLHLGEQTIDVVDLPGTYSLTSKALEESITREHIVSGQTDVVINVVDASSLERSLSLTIQLLELQQVMVIALNQVDLAERNGLRVDAAGLSRRLGVPVIPTIGTRNMGLLTLVREAIRVRHAGSESPVTVKYSTEIENRIGELVALLDDVDFPHPKRWMALMLLEDDPYVTQMVHEKKQAVGPVVERVKAEIQRIYGQDSSAVLTTERFRVAAELASTFATLNDDAVSPRRDVDRLALHPVFGYLLMAATLLLMFYSVFMLGDVLSGVLGGSFSVLKTWYNLAFTGDVAAFVWLGLVEGVVAGATVALPYIAPFYIALSLLEDTGYLSRIAFLMDTSMHKIGIHGKGFIPLMLGFGCNVPGCLGCRILETKRERLICAFSASLVPCTARSIVIMGLVAVYVGFGWAILLYLIDIALVLALGRAAFKLLPGETSGLIMDMPSYRRPTVMATLGKAWTNLREFVFTAFPIIIVGNLVIQLIDAAGLLTVIESSISPVTVIWLGLPAATGVVLIFGVLRKELTLIMLAALMGTTNFALVLTPVQMIVFAFVVMVYIPCLATLAALGKEVGYRRTALICVVEVTLAVILGGILQRILLITGIV